MYLLLNSHWQLRWCFMSIYYIRFRKLCIHRYLYRLSHFFFSFVGWLNVTFSSDFIWYDWCWLTTFGESCKSIEQMISWHFTLCETVQLQLNPWLWNTTIYINWIIRINNRKLNKTNDGCTGARARSHESSTTKTFNIKLIYCCGSDCCSQNEVIIKIHSRLNLLRFMSIYKPNCDRYYHFLLLFLLFFLPYEEIHERSKRQKKK